VATRRFDHVARSLTTTGTGGGIINMNAFASPAAITFNAGNEIMRNAANDAGGGGGISNAATVTFNQPISA